MKATKLGFLAITVMLTASGCLTSEEPFYQKGDIKVDDRIVGNYVPPPPETGATFNISKIDDLNEHPGQYYVTVNESDHCSMKFRAVLFQVGTNRFLDLAPVIEACDHVAGGPPSIMEMLQIAALQPMHMVVGVNIATNELKLGVVDYPHLQEMAKNHSEYFKPAKPDQLPRLEGDTKRLQEFLLRFGGDTNVFAPGGIKREFK